jgi:hypothetical protein
MTKFGIEQQQPRAKLRIDGEIDEAEVHFV